MSSFQKAFMPALIIALLSLSSRASAQYTGPVNVYPQQGQTPYYPVVPGGLVTGNPTPYYNPNAIVAGGGGGMTYWDPNRGWVTHSQTSYVLNSATSPGRYVAPGTSIQYYRYWNGSQWINGRRWFGQDGLWHGDHTQTTFGPNGTNQTNVAYSRAR